MAAPVMRVQKAAQEIQVLMVQQVPEAQQVQPVTQAR